MTNPAQEIYDSLPEPDRRAVDAIRLMLDAYNTKDGNGLFSGVSRYAILEERVRLAAIRSLTLKQWWSNACRSLKLPMHPKDLDARLIEVLRGPDEGKALSRLADQTAVVITIARSMRTEIRQIAAGAPDEPKAPKQRTAAANEIDQQLPF